MRMLKALLLGPASLLMLLGLGCDGAPGKPGPGPEVPRPDQVLDFATLYKQNCVACHGDSRQPGAAISLANPVYLAVAGEQNLKLITANGIPGKLMPGFSQSAGGMLTEEQVEVLAKGMLKEWGKPSVLAGQAPPPYRAAAKGDVRAGQEAYGSYCARCHGAGGEGNPGMHLGSIVDPPYLGLISDQGLRSITMAGMPEQGMPDWRSDAPGHAMSDAEITDVVAWLSSHRDTETQALPATPSTSPIHSSATKVTHEPASVR